MKLKYINKRLKTGWRCVFGNGGQKLHNYAKADIEAKFSGLVQFML